MNSTSAKGKALQIFFAMKTMEFKGPLCRIQTIKSGDHSILPSTYIPTRAFFHGKLP